jgi:hypothetical protein
MSKENLLILMVSLLLLACNSKKDNTITKLNCLPTQLTYQYGFIQGYPKVVYTYEKEQISQINHFDSTNLLVMIDKYYYDANGSVSNYEQFKLSGGTFNQAINAKFYYKNQKLISLYTDYLYTQVLSIDSCFYDQNGLLQKILNYTRYGGNMDTLYNHYDSLVFNNNKDLSEHWTKWVGDNLVYKLYSFEYGSKKNTIYLIPPIGVIPNAKYILNKRNNFKKDGTQYPSQDYKYEYDELGNITKVYEYFLDETNTSIYQYKCN